MEGGGDGHISKDSYAVLLGAFSAVSYAVEMDGIDGVGVLGGEGAE